MADVSEPRDARRKPYSRSSSSTDHAASEDRWQHDRYSAQDSRGTGRSGNRRGGGRDARADNRDPHARSAATSDTPTAKLTVNNLHYEVSSRELKDLFEQIGPTVQCFIKFDRSGRSTGVAKVVYKDVQDAVRAKQEYDGANAKGQPITISFAPMREINPIAGAASAVRRNDGARGRDSLMDRLGSTGEAAAAGLLSRMGSDGHARRAPSNAPRGPSAPRGPRVPESHRSRGQPRQSTDDRRVRRPARATADSLDAELDAFMKAPSSTSDSIHAPTGKDADLEMA